jgi:hypothetical protein
MIILTREMDLTAFRQDLTPVIDALDDTGPLRLTRYGLTVAEIRSATPEGDRIYTQQIISTLQYLNALGITESLLALGIDTLAALTELADRHRKFTEDGIVFDPYPEHALPGSGSITVDEALAYLYFGDSYPVTAVDPYAWFETCMALQRAARAREMDPALPQPDGYDEIEPSFVQTAINSGHTPDSLLAFGETALDQGVPLSRLADMMGRHPVPADVAALPDYSDHLLDSLVRLGLPHAEAISVFRRGLPLDVAKAFTQAGIRTAAGIAQLVDDDVEHKLAVRAHRDGIPPAVWSIQVPQVQRLRYKESGHLPFSLLAQAAKENVSLVRWDNARLPCDKDRISMGSYYAALGNAQSDVSWRTAEYPWKHIFPDRVLDVARVSITPAFAEAYGALMRSHFAKSNDDFVDSMIRAKTSGLTSAIAEALSRSEKRPVFTPSQLIAVLDEGLDDPAMARYLADRYKDPDSFVALLWEVRDRQPATDAFVTRVANTEVWQTVTAIALEIQKAAKAKYLRGEVFLTATANRLLEGKQLTHLHVSFLLNWAAHLTKGSSHSWFLKKGWQEEHYPRHDAVRQLGTEFSELFQQDTGVGA